jgi:hypothetical protein
MLLLFSKQLIACGFAHVGARSQLKLPLVPRTLCARTQLSYPSTCEVSPLRVLSFLGF